MIISHILLSIGWLAYGAIHSILAVTKVKTYLQQALGLNTAALRLIYNLIAVVLLGLMIWWSFSVRSEKVFDRSLLTNILGGMFTVVGLSIMTVCVAGYFSQMSGVKDEIPTLKTTGVNRYVRHPLYTGTFTFLIGLFFFMPFYNTLVSVVSIIFYTLVGIHWEEQKLIKTFGEDYRRYKKTTPAILPLPGV